MLAHRLMLLRYVVLAVFLVFVGRLAYLQLLHGADLRKASEQNHLRWVRSPAPRGLITDRQGRVLATSTPALTAWLISGEVPRRRWDALANRLLALGLFPDRATMEEALRDARRYPSYIPLPLKRRLTIAEVTRIEEELPFLPGIYLKAEPVRSYPGGPLAAHVLGYLREIDAGELQQREAQGYRPGDRIGKAGIERAFEDTLRGQEGGDQIEVDAYGRVLRMLKSVQPRPGTALALTLDADIQRAAEEGLHGRRGAAVALDPRTGEVLALVSAPAYDLNVMSGRRSPEVQAWLTRSRAELNRAATGTYPPGSVFKIVTAATALEEGKVPNGFYCDGKYHGIRCWKHSGHGYLDLTGALAQSCNVAFMQLAEKVGVDDLAAMARRFGLGHPTGIGDAIPESAGIVPDVAWARSRRYRWQLGDTLQMGIGQSSLTVTPLQSARLVAAIANGGTLVQPTLVKRIGNREQAAPSPIPIKLQEKTIRRITRGLQAVVGEGTARALQDPELRIAGKTGTAQNPGGPDHAWFAGFAPAEQPVIAVAVLVEAGGHGGTTAAPIAEAMIRTALEGPVTANAAGASGQ